MHFDWVTLALQTVNFAVLVWLLRRFLYRPVLRIVDARRAEIDHHYREAQKADAHAREQLAAIETERAGIASEREAALTEAAAQIDEEAKARQQQIEREIVAEREAARKTLAAERDQALGECRNTALDLGAEIARRLLDELPDGLLAEAWLQRIVDHLDGLPAEQKLALVKQLADGQSLRIVTAAPLPPPATEKWQRALRHSLDADIAMAFVADPALIAGAELYFPQAVIRLSWHSLLAALRLEIQKDEDAA
jgi:F-type H+-transporting ATPase subunit b